MYIGFHVKYSLFLSDFNRTWIFSKDLRKKISNFMKIRPVEAELFHADGRTDMTMLIVSLRHFANAIHKRSKHSHLKWYSNPHCQWGRLLLSRSKDVSYQYLTFPCCAYDSLACALEGYTHTEHCIFYQMPSTQCLSKDTFELTAEW